MKFLTFLSTLAAWRRLWDKATKKHRKKQARDQKTPELSLHFGDFLAVFWSHFVNVFLGTLPEGLLAVMGAILCHFGAQNGGKSVPKSIFWEKCRHAFGSSRLDRIACRASPDRSHNPEKTCYKSDAILKLSFYRTSCPK